MLSKVIWSHLRSFEVNWDHLESFEIIWSHISHAATKWAILWKYNAAQKCTVLFLSVNTTDVRESASFYAGLGIQTGGEGLKMLPSTSSNRLVAPSHSGVKNYWPCFCSSKHQGNDKFNFVSLKFIKSVDYVYGGFQLVDMIITELKNYMTC